MNAGTLFRISIVGLGLGAGACGDSHVAPDAALLHDGQVTPDAPATTAVTIPFAANFGTTAFTCGGTYTVGTPTNSLNVTDLRFYVYDVNLIAADGTAAPVTLTPGPFQSSSVALMDFEDGCGTDGTPAMHTAITGTVTGGPFTQVQFTLGVPAAADHLDIATATAPLDVTGMYWAWQYGYKFFKLDASVPGSGGGSAAPFFLHLGSSGCPGDDGSAAPTSPCLYPNRVTYQLAGYAAGKTIVADIASVLATFDVAVNTDGTAPGCMSEEADPDCEVILPRMGVNDAAPQVLFSIQ